MDQATNQTTTAATKLIHDYRKISTLMKGGLPTRVISMLEHTAADVLVELTEATPQTWPEFAEKVAVLVGALPADPTSGWLARIRDSFAEDLLWLPVSSPDIFLGARCQSYPACNGGCGCGCARELQAAE